MTNTGNTMNTETKTGRKFYDYDIKIEPESGQVRPYRGTVYLNGDMVGQTGYCKSEYSCMGKTGEMVRSLISNTP